MTGEVSPISLAAGAPPQTKLGELRMLPQTPSPTFGASRHVRRHYVKLNDQELVNLAYTLDIFYNYITEYIRSNTSLSILKI